MLYPAQQHSPSAEMGGPMQQPEEPCFQGHIPTTMLETSEHHRLQGLLLSPCYWKLHYRRAGCTRAHIRHCSFPMEPKWQSIWKWAVKHGSTPETWGVVLWICFGAVSISIRIKLITFSFELILTCKYNALLFLSSSYTIKASLVMYILRRLISNQTEICSAWQGKVQVLLHWNCVWRLKGRQNWSLSDQSWMTANFQANVNAAKPL